MRQIGQLADETQARCFSDHLVANRIRHEVERDGSAWIIWIQDEEQVADANARLARFRADPTAPEFRSAAAQAAAARSSEAREQADYQRRVRTRRALFPSFGGYGIGPLTFSLVMLCVAMAVYTKLGYNREMVSRFVLAAPENADGTFLPEVRAGEFWRLFAPAFVHFGPVHLIFNLLWFFQLGGMIEARRGALTLALLVAATAVGPFLAEYLWRGPANVAGLSGVVYGLAGYVWMRGKYDRASGVYLDPRNVQWLLIWLVVCFTGALGPVANLAHLSGLIIGAVWGRLAAWFAVRR